MNAITEAPPAKSPRGFAAMDPARLRAVSSKGGSAPHPKVKRGFAAMNEARRLEVSRQGLEARRKRLPGTAGVDGGDTAATDQPGT